MKRAYTRMMLRSIKGSLSRYLSIFAIVALGVGFLAGLMAATPDMQETADRYYDEANTCDLYVKGTLGVTQEDADAIRTIDGVDSVMAVRTTDVFFLDGEGTEWTTRLCEMPLDRQTDESYINRVNLEEGRMPAAPDECVIEIPTGFSDGLKLGDTLTFSSENSDYDSRKDTYHYDTMTIVGRVRSPYYLTIESQSTHIGNGHLTLIAYAPTGCYSMEAYTDLLILSETAKKMNAFDDSYDRYIADIRTQVEDMADARCTARYQDLQNEAQQKLDASRKDYETQKTDAEQQLNDAAQELADQEKRLSDTEQSLDEGERALSEAKQSLAAQKADASSQLAAAKAQLDNNEQLLTAQESALNEFGSRLSAAAPSMEAARAAKNAGITLAPEIEKALAEYDANAAEYNRQTATLSQAKASFRAAKDEYAAKEAQTLSGFQEAEAQLTAKEQELQNGRAEVDAGKEKLAQGKAEYEAKKADSEKQLADAEQKLNDAQADIDAMKQPEWLIFDREDGIASFASFSANVEKVAAIAKVFPVFFFLVAALVALTGMTRMIEEERTQIGTLRALGYSRGSILFYYIFYCLSATLAGCAVGLLCGFWLFPHLIFNAYGIMYRLPNLITPFRWEYAVFSTLAAVGCTLAATLFAGWREVTETAASLMRPKAPKAGKRILLERITPIWKHFSFSNKVTARNIFRYRKRLWMTLIGIAGCTALMLTGFGLRDAIADIVRIQYEQIQKYDLTIATSRVGAEKDDPVLSDFLTDPAKVSGYTLVSEESGSVENDQENGSVTLLVPSDSSSFSEFFNLRKRTDHSAVPFDDNSVLMTEKMAGKLSLSPGDTFTVTNAGGIHATLTLTGICENYIYSYVYLSRSQYAAAFGSECSFQNLLIKTTADSEQSRDDMQTVLLSSDSLASLMFSQTVINTFSDMLSRINYIVMVLIVAAAALAMIVIYSLTDINLCERRRELATLRVLGFHRRETAMYIFRETLILSALGTAIGLIFGIGLTRFVVTTAEVDSIMFGRDIYPMSFVGAALLTLCFSLIINLSMYPRFGKINMVESMKANE